MPTTTESLTEQQIRALRREAFAAGDYAMGVICDLALDAKIDLDDYTCLDHRDDARIRRMGQQGAFEAIVDAINNAEAQ